MPSAVRGDGAGLPRRDSQAEDGDIFGAFAGLAAGFAEGKLPFHHLAAVLRAEGRDQTGRRDKLSPRQSGDERQGAGLVGLEPHRDHLIGFGNHQLAGEADAIPRENRARHSVHQIKRALVAFRGNRAADSVQRDLRDLKAVDLRGEREPIEPVCAGLGHGEGLALVALLERYVMPAVEFGPCVAIGRAFENPCPGIAVGHVFGTGERVVRGVSRRGEFELPGNRRARCGQVGDTPFAGGIAIGAVVDGLAIAFAVTAGGSDLDASEIKRQVGEDLITSELVVIEPALHPVGVAEVRERLARAVEVPGEELFADFRQALVGIGAVGVIGAAGPHGVFVEDDALAARAAEVHGSEPAVAERK